MLRSLRSTHRMPLLLILGACLLLLGAIPPRPIGAAIRQEEINNALEDFKNGRFQRTSLSTALNTAASTRVLDRIGAVQLGPIGLLKGWFPSPYKLKKPLIRMGAASIGNRIYVIGGSTNQNFASVPVAEVW